MNQVIAFRGDRLWRIWDPLNLKEVSLSLTVLGKPKHFLTTHPNFLTSMNLEPRDSSSFAEKKFNKITETKNRMLCVLNEAMTQYLKG